MKHIRLMSRRPEPAQSAGTLIYFALITDLLSGVIIPLVQFKEDNEEPEEKTLAPPTNVEDN